MATHIGIMVVEGYLPDESLEWDEITHMMSSWGEVLGQLVLILVEASSHDNL